MGWEQDQDPYPKKKNLTDPEHCIFFITDLGTVLFLTPFKRCLAAAIIPYEFVIVFCAFGKIIWRRLVAFFDLFDFDLIIRLYGTVVMKSSIKIVASWQFYPNHFCLTIRLHSVYFKNGEELREHESFLYVPYGTFMVGTLFMHFIAKSIR